MGLLSLIGKAGGALNRVGATLDTAGIPLAKRLLTNLPKRAGIIGAAYAGNAVVQGFASQTERLMRGYYGDKEYEQKYQAGLDTVTGVSSALAGYVGLSQAFNVSPISAAGRISGNIAKAAYRGAKGGLQKFSSARAQATRVAGKLAVRSAKYKAVGNRAVSAGQKAEFWGAREAKARQAYTYQKIGASGYDRLGLTAPNQSKVLSSARALRDTKRTRAAYAGQARAATQQMGRMGTGKRIKFYSKPTKSTIKNHEWLSHASLALGAAAGYGAGSFARLPRAMATPEGNITSFGSNDTSEKLNFSTAGLVQALHSSRRRLD